MALSYVTMGRSSVVLVLFTKTASSARELKKFCNITSWCVLDNYRQHSMCLAMTIINQEGYSFTDFSPTKVVGSTLQFLKLVPLNEEQVVILNLPWLPLSRHKVLQNADDIKKSLRGNALTIYEDHAPFPWLKHVLIGKPNQWCHVIIKKRTFKGFPTASIIYLSDKELFGQYHYQLSTYLFLNGYLSPSLSHPTILSIPVNKLTSMNNTRWHYKF